MAVKVEETVRVHESEIIRNSDRMDGAFNEKQILIPHVMPDSELATEHRAR